MGRVQDWRFRGALARKVRLLSLREILVLTSVSVLSPDHPQGLWGREGEDKPQGVFQARIILGTLSNQKEDGNWNV